jgi:sugar phosphate isomerase/epimerase
MRTEIPESATSPTKSAHSILISLSAFGAAEVRRHGQLWFAELSLAAGADGIEVRSELMLDAPNELPALAKLVATHGKRSVYSCADGLWTPEGTLNLRALQNALAAAHTLGARQLKMSIGGFGRSSHASLRPLHQQLQSANLELLIENDQTDTAGTLAALHYFFECAQAHDLSLGMTFDMGNWHWTGECPLQAAAALALQVRYVHCKGVQRQPQRWVAVPLAHSSAPWRAVLRQLPANVPWAIEYPLTGDDLASVTHAEIAQLRRLAATYSEHQTALAHNNG